MDWATLIIFNWHLLTVGFSDDIQDEIFEQNFSHSEHI